MASTLNNSVTNPAWLDWITTLMGGGSRQSYAATLPPNLFHCLLDALPVHLIPQRGSRQSYRSTIQDQSLFLNPKCNLCRPGQLPPELVARSEELSGFALQGTIAWVQDSITGALFPFWLGPELETAVRALGQNELAPDTLPSEVRSLLVHAGILISVDKCAANDTQKTVAFEASASLFREHGYVPLPDLIHPFHLAALRRYYRQLVRSGTIQLGDGQSPRRYVAYNDPIARFFHRQILSTVSAVAGEPLKASYVYFASYLSGAELKKHTDREQCEFSVTLCLDFSPEPELETPWPIQLETSAGSVKVYQALGDGLAYRGTQVPHFRETLGEGQTSTSIFFHYVAADFAGSLD